MNLNHEAYVREAKSIASHRQISWELGLNADGMASGGRGWNLNSMAGVPPPPTFWMNDLGTDRRTVEVLNSAPPPGPIRTYKKVRVSVNWEDLLKPALADQLLVRRNTCGHVSGSVIRPLRVLATCLPGKKPWEVTADDVNFALQIARKVQKFGQLADLIGCLSPITL
jgi:hypothetical protein